MYFTLCIALQEAVLGTTIPATTVYYLLPCRIEPQSTDLIDSMVKGKL